MTRRSRAGVLPAVLTASFFLAASFSLGGCSGLTVFGFDGTGTNSETGTGTDTGGTGTGTTTDPGTAPGTATTPAAIPDAAWPAVVRYVHDGDTLYLTADGSAEELKVRLIGIDTPEVGDASECYGDEATELLRDFLPEGTAVWALADRDPYDRFGRSLLYLFTADGSFVNYDMVSLGAAEAVLFEPNDLYYDDLVDAEYGARDLGLGLWGSCR